MATPILTNVGALIAVEMVAGEPWAYTVTIYESGAVVNIAGRSYASQLRDEAGALIASATCTVVSPTTLGKVSVAFTGAQTTGLVPGQVYAWSLQETNAGLTSELLRADVTIYKRITA